MTFALTCLGRHKIDEPSLGLNEPSGLALAFGGDGLWTVSDDTGRVFRLGLDGRLDKQRSFDVPVSGMEGITGDDGGRTLFAVREETNAVIKLDVEAREVTQHRRLSKMKGFKPIKRYFTDDKDENKGLEGITWNTHTGTLFALKEGEPGLFIEISPGLDRILSHARLGEKNGFVDPRKKPEKVDYSGICYDPTRKAFWIVSHKARRVFLYSRAENRVVHSAPLDWVMNGASKSIKQAEGVAIDTAARRLYVVCDTKALLYVFDVRP